MAQWTEIEFSQLGPKHLNNPIYVRFPEKYAKDFLMGTLEYTFANSVQNQLVLRGGATVEFMKSGDQPQGTIFILSD